ncbi:hypothetical protein [Natrinema gari]|uniref:Uncharacterized protein n=1 Tax=Natrinema gari JCM 14663 TaxID=1230459 RepID=L9YX08_9EURY|nr:hypothetical protein [Natrinema gari]ELY77443.1 hypothetical protein C486_15104 [Natrinema gari JCM 14663]
MLDVAHLESLAALQRDLDRGSVLSQLGDITPGGLAGVSERFHEPVTGKGFGRLGIDALDGHR